MRIVVQRVTRSSVTIKGELISEIGKGLMALIGVQEGDTEKDAQLAAEKIAGLRIFEDDDGKMNRSLADVGGQVLVVSQFTLYGNCRKGRRPSFVGAAGPDLGAQMYELFLRTCAELGFPPQHGQFGADMAVASINDGPVTLILDTAELM